MRAIVWQGPERMTIEERPDPGDPDAGEVIVRPEAVGICGSEVEGYLGHMGNREPPLVMGHEFAGVVVAAGAGAGELEGERVAVNPLSGCGRCRLCRAGHANLCPDRRLIGVHSDGAFADLVRAPAASARSCPTTCRPAPERSSSRWPTACTPCGSGSPAGRSNGPSCWAPERSGW